MSETQSPEEQAQPPSADSWAEIDWSQTQQQYPPAQQEWDRWMCRKGDSKAPFSPWTDEDAHVFCNECETTCDNCPHHAGFKWGSPGSEQHVLGEFSEAREWAEHLLELSSDLCYIQSEDDPFAFVDGDDVRDPETGDVHPEFVAFLEKLGVSYADISTSGSGIHVVYLGEAIPLDGVKTPAWEIDDEPFGANDERPAIEIYTGKHVNVATGQHVEQTGEAIQTWDEEALVEALQDGGIEERDTSGDVDLDGYEGSATEEHQTTTEIRDLFNAIDRLDARRVADKTIVHRWNDDASTSSGERAFVPSWGRNANGTANIVNDERWVDTGGNGYGGVTAMAAIDAGVADESIQGAPSGEDWFNAVDHLRDLGFSIPLLLDEDDGGQNPFYRVDLQDYCDGNPYDNPDRLAVVCLRAAHDEDEPRVDTDTQPPAAALAALYDQFAPYPVSAESVEQDPSMALDVFQSLDPADVRVENGRLRVD